MNFIDSEKDLFYNETNPQSTQENIYCTYLILANLKKNNIKHALVYIGDITNINYEDIYYNIFKKRMNSSNETLKKEIIPKIRQNYAKLKQNIKEFEKKVSDISIIKLNNVEPIFQEMKNAINNIIKSPKSQLMKKLLKYIKFDAFLYIVKNDDKENTLIYQSIMNSPAIQKLKLFFNLKCSTLTKEESEVLIEKVKECPEQYGKKHIFLLCEAEFYLENLGDIYLPAIIIQGFYYKEKTNEVKVGFHFIFKFLNNLPILFTVNCLVDKKIKEIKKYFDKEMLLQKENRPKKILNDFNHLFQQNEKNYCFVEKIANMDFNFGNNLNDLIDYHNKALVLFEEINGKLDNSIRIKIIENIKLKLKELIDSILCSNVYTIVFKKISDILNEEIQSTIQMTLMPYKTTPYNLIKQST